MAAMCSFHSMPVAHSPVPSVVSREYQIGPCPTPTHVVEHQAPRNPSPVEPDLISMNFLPHLAIARYPIATACHTGNFIATPPPFPEDAAANTAPPSLPPLSSPSPSSPDRHVPRACHGVERRQRSRPSSRGASDYHSFSKLTRAERTAAKAASSRRVAFAEHAHQIPPSSLWTASADGTPPTPTALALDLALAAGAPRELKRRPPTPSPIPARGTTMSLSLTRASFDAEAEADGDASPGFDADVEVEPADADVDVDVARRGGRHTYVGASERLTIVVPGGKSEAYVAMAFERSCSVAAEVDDDKEASTVHDDASSFIPPATARPMLLAPEEDGLSCGERVNGKTGLKIKIPLPNPLFMLSLRLASSCRVSDEEAASAAVEGEAEAETMEVEYPTRCAGGPQAGYTSPTPTTSSTSESSRSGCGSSADNNNSTTTTTTMIMASRSRNGDRDQGQGQDQDHPVLVPFSFNRRVGASYAPAASRSRSRTPPVAPPPTPDAPHDGRVARRIARHAARAPYRPIDRPRTTR